MKYIFACILFFGVVMCTSVSAMTRAEIEAEITRLTAVAEVLASQIRALGIQPTTGAGTYTGVTSTPRFSATDVCTRIGTTLRQGMTSSDVVNAQDALASIGVFSGASTGYFGAQTKAAVQQFQTTSGIIASGVINAETANALYQACTGGATYGQSGTGGVAAVDQSSLSASPVVGNAPQSVTALFAINGTTCSSYSLDWGDGTAPVVRNGATTGCVTDSINRQLAHVYTRSGVFTLTLRTIRGNISAAPIVAQTTVTVR